MRTQAAFSLKQNRKTGVFNREGRRADPWPACEPKSRTSPSVLTLRKPCCHACISEVLRNCDSHAMRPEPRRAFSCLLSRSRVDRQHLALAGGRRRSPGMGARQSPGMGRFASAGIARCLELLPVTLPAATDCLMNLKLIRQLGFATASGLLATRGSGGFGGFARRPDAGGGTVMKRG